MLTRIDHVTICVPDLEHGIDAYTRLGFNVYPGGVHPGRGTHNAIAFHEEDYLGLMSVRDREEYLAAAPGGGLLEFLSRCGGLRYVIVQSDDLGADVAAMRRALGPAHPLPIFFIQHLTPLEERRASAPQAGRHPNGLRGAERAYIVVPDVAAAAETYARVLGMPVPAIQRGAQGGHGGVRSRPNRPHCGEARRAGSRRPLLRGSRLTSPTRSGRIGARREGSPSPLRQG